MTARKEKKADQRLKVPDRGRIQADIELAMFALSLWLPSDVCERYIPVLAEKYVYMAFESLCAEEPATEKEIQSQFLNIKEQATALLITMMTLRGSTINALYLAIKEVGEGFETPSMIPPAMKNLNPRHPTIGELETYLQRLIDAASVAKIPDNAKKHKGPDRKLDVFEIAKSAARDFHSLTGKFPTTGQKKNGFRDFLTAIFEALNMPHHSAESFAKRARNWWENDRLREDDPAEIMKLASRIRVLEN